LPGNLNAQSSAQAVITPADLPKYRKLDVTRYTPRELSAVLQNTVETKSSDKGTLLAMHNWSKVFKYLMAD
jgi:hypothetical protein